MSNFAIQSIQTLEALQEALENISALEDADIDLIDGVLTIEFENGAQLIINRQEAAAQIWLSSILGPGHFGYDAEKNAWINDRDGRELIETLAEALTRSTGQTVTPDDLRAS
ncbi:MAG: iron donor protein CyaY [Thioalkalivibrionaceae bacterium]